MSVCVNKEDPYGEAYTESRNLIIIRKHTSRQDYVYYCYTPEELEMYLNNYEKPVPSLYSENAPFVEMTSNDAETIYNDQLNREKYYYALPPNNLLIDHTLYEAFVNKCNTLEIIPGKVKKMFRSLGVGAIHGDELPTYKVKCISRCDVKDIQDCKEDTFEHEYKEREMKEGAEPDFTNYIPSREYEGNDLPTVFKGEGRSQYTMEEILINPREIYPTIKRENLKDYETLSLALVNMDGLMLEYVPDDAKNSDMVEIAVDRDPEALRFVPERLLTVPLILKALETSPDMYEILPENFKQNQEIIKLAVSGNVSMVKFVPETSRDYDKFLEYNPFVIKYFPEEEISVDRARKAVNTVKECIRFVKSPEILYALLMEDIGLFRYIKNQSVLQLMSTTDRMNVISALSKNNILFSMLSSSLVFEYLKNNPNGINTLPNPSQTYIEFALQNGADFNKDLFFFALNRSRMANIMKLRPELVLQMDLESLNALDSELGLSGVIEILIERGNYQAVEYILNAPLKNPIYVIEHGEENERPYISTLIEHYKSNPNMIRKIFGKFKGLTKAEYMHMIPFDPYIYEMIEHEVKFDIDDQALLLASSQALFPMIVSSRRRGESRAKFIRNLIQSNREVVENIPDTDLEEALKVSDSLTILDIIENKPYLIQSIPSSLLTPELCQNISLLHPEYIPIKCDEAVREPGKRRK